MTMNVSLTPELEALVQERVKSGRYSSASEVVREALRLMGAYETVRSASLAQLRADVDAAVKQLAAGEIVEIDAPDIKRRGRERLMALKKNKA